MTNHLKLISTQSVLHKLLCNAAIHQFGPETTVKYWWGEHSNHGDSYRGFDYNSGKWLQVDLSSTIDT